MHCLRSYFVCKFPDSGRVFGTWPRKQVAQQISASKKSLALNWVETLQKWKAKPNSKAFAKKAKVWEEILTTFHSQNPNGIKRDLS